MFIGIAYKKNVNDVRESPAIKLLNLLFKNKAIVSYHDPYINEFEFLHLEKSFQKSIEIKPKNISNHDLIIITTDHDNIDYKLILKHAKLILDLRGRYSQNFKKIIRA